ncbi:uncharacterized protein LOC144316411 [Canis aureus]
MALRVYYIRLLHGAYFISCLLPQPCEERPMAVCRELGDGALSRVARTFCQHESSKNSLSGLGTDLWAGVTFRKGLAEKTTSGHRVGVTPDTPTGLCGLLNFRNRTENAAACVIIIMRLANRATFQASLARPKQETPSQGQETFWDFSSIALDRGSCAYDESPDAVLPRALSCVSENSEELCSVSR